MVLAVLAVQFRVLELTLNLRDISGDNEFNKVEQYIT